MAESEIGLEQLKELARQRLRREYEGMRDALVALWLSGKPLPERVRKHGR